MFEYAETKGFKCCSRSNLESKKHCPSAGTVSCHIPTWPGSRTEWWPEVCECLQHCAHQQQASKMQTPHSLGFLLTFYHHHQYTSIGAVGFACNFNIVLGECWFCALFFLLFLWSLDWVNCCLMLNSMQGGSHFSVVWEVIPLTLCLHS